MTSAHAVDAIRFLERGDIMAGRLACRRALAAHDVVSFVPLALRAFETDQGDIAVALFRRALATRCASGQQGVDLAVQLAQGGKLAEAVGVLSGVPEGAPSWARAREISQALLSEPRISFFHFARAAQVDVVIDVGANTGQFGRAMRTMGYEGLLVSLEPVAGPFSNLEQYAAGDDLWLTERLALGAVVGIETIHVAANAGASSSLLPMLERHSQAAPSARVIGTEQVNVDTLDNIFAKHLGRGGRRAMLKLDVQGYERVVLQGASSLDAVPVIYAEVSTVPLYDGQCLMPAFLDYLYGRGFALADLERHMLEPRTRRVLQFNATFVCESNTNPRENG